MLKKHDRGASKHVYGTETDYGSWIYAYEPGRKQQSTVWVFQDEQNPTKAVRAPGTSEQLISCFFGKTGHAATVPLGQAEQTILSGIPPFVCQLTSQKSGKPTAEGGSLFTTTMRAPTHRLKQLHFRALKTTI
ncbi:hypothetical protein V3C99_014988 [Haemonchus contortus]